MRIIRGVSALAIVSVIAAACSSGAATPAPSAVPTATSAASASATPEPASPTPDACAPDQLATKTAGTLLFGADNPAYPPYYQPSDPAVAPWEFGDPTNGKGFESAVAYAVAKAMGYSADKVAWAPVPFNNAIQPGPKDFDVYITQVSYTPERAQGVDITKGYYFVNQAIVALKDNAIAGVTSIAALKPFKFAAQVGTTSLDLITETIAPDQEPLVLDTNDAAIEAVKNGQADAIVVDLPTAYFIRDAEQIVNSVIVGQFEAVTGGEYFGMALDKDSPLTDCVNAALDRLRAGGELQAITDEWLSSQGSAPVFQP
ncbi:MAG: amino acid ABC transporter substrate-binding protein [Chloroflexi bacterium]|nr:MAG: amino acid ABC transporter substrate-binding protein [Chloroflexota bacterium]